MNRFDTTTTGGHPFALNDLQFIIESLSEGFKGIANQFGTQASNGFYLSTPNGSISGTPLRLNISECYAAMAGEIFLVPAQSVPFSFGNEYWYEVKEYPSPDGSKVFENSQTVETYIVRELEIKQGSSVPANVMDVYANTMYDIYRQGLASESDITTINNNINAVEARVDEIEDTINDAWIKFNTSVTHANGSNVVIGLIDERYYKVIGKTCHLAVRLSLNVPLATSEIRMSYPSNITPLNLFTTWGSVETNGISKAMTVTTQGGYIIIKSESGDFDMSATYNFVFTFPLS